MQEIFTDPTKVKSQVDRSLADIEKAPGLDAEQIKLLKRFLGDLHTFIDKADPQTMAKSPFSARTRVKSVPVVPQTEGEPKSAERLLFRRLFFAVSSAVS
jgi:hypothetical protein